MGLWNTAWRPVNPDSPRVSGWHCLIAANNRRDLWLKIGIYWVIIVIVLWAASAAVNAPNTNIALAYVAKAVELVLLGILLRIRTAR